MMPRRTSRPCGGFRRGRARSCSGSALPPTPVTRDTTKLPRDVSVSTESLARATSRDLINLSSLGEPSRRGSLTTDAEITSLTASLA